ncbi:SusC/RagA family TonB-linked outer membrane protein [Chitinophaga oryzae]|uniref:SusC/RagA family TonB-linked outer membrane protein n=1 Tax=Chitinophaga oryzae TaxID=2725414 RepID=A0AAE6ZJL4_9BACT|nr:SusC/RagA family TonB-linked outer membrane protein [Chitinophaga oryzae]QJB33368.1 SusC/RagA family TonB-linked outer membrane protein [Chitinophaga oryzae]QJB39886.1 SusC/RagA family TonB-linked outer membrane protein [Chitinophaga oryzae]
MRRSFLLTTLLFLCCCFAAWAQDKKAVTGTVKDEKGTPLPGVTVKEKGTANGAMSGADGTFKVQVASDATLVLSYIGFMNQEVPVNGQTTLTIVLKEDNKNLNEVVVTAMGMKREQRKLGYAVTELKGADVAKTNSINPVSALQGKVAGLDISAAAGGPAAAPRIVLRGAKSLNGKDQPIFIVDGVIFENDESAADVNFGNVLKNLNPDDYESVTVLKGAAATALYGSRAINGAILITTKKGNARKGIGVTVSQTAQIEKVYRGAIDLQNGYGQGIDGTYDNTAGGYSFGPKMDGRMVQLPNGTSVPFTPKPNNAKDLYQTGKYFNTNVAMEGGNDKGTFRLSYSHLDNNSVSPNNSFGRNTFAFRGSSQISRVLSADAGVTYATSKTLNPDRQGGDYTNYNIGRKWVYVFPRNYDPSIWSKPENYLGPNGGRANLSTNPGADYFYQQAYNSWTRKESLITGNFSLTAEATSWLKFVGKANFSSEQSTDERKEVGTAAFFKGSDGFYSVAGVNKSQYTFTGMAIITPKLGKKFDGNLNLGAETWNSGIGKQYNNYSQGGLRIPFLYDISNSVGAPIVKNDPLLRKRINSVFFAASLAYNNELFLDVTGRNDWSSALTYPKGSKGTTTNSYFYPSVSAAWEFTQTLKEEMPSWISYGKLRASYAMVGGDLDPYQINTGYYTTGLFQGSSTGENLPLVNIFNSDILPNMALKPSISKSWELGANVRFFNNRLGFDFAWYRTNITNQIINLPTPIESGVTSRYINAGSMINRGIELSINGTPIQNKNFTWDVTLNGSRNKNKIVSLTPGVDQLQLNEDQGVKAIASVGGSYGNLVTDYGYTRDANGKPIITLGGSDFPYKFVRGNAVVGNIMPDFNLGLQNNFTYKNWSLGVLIQARIGGDFFSASHQYGTGRGTTANTMYGRDSEHGGITFTDGSGVTRNDGMIPDAVFQKGTTISKDGQNIVLDGMTYQQAYEKGYVSPLTPFQYYGMIGDWGIGIREASVFDASYVALREVSLGYSLPTDLVQRWRLNSLRVSLVGRNLGYLFNNLPDHINPEAVRNNKTSAFSEYGAVPFVRNMGLTVQVGF